MEVLDCFISWYPARLNIFWNEGVNKYQELIVNKDNDMSYQSRLGVVQMDLINDSRLDLEKVLDVVKKVPRIVESKIMENLELSVYKFKKLNKINIVARIHAVAMIQFDIHFENLELFKGVKIKYSERLEIL